MPAVLKLTCQGEFHRIRLDGELTYETVWTSVLGLYPDAVRAQYVDEENDLCTLCPESFADFVEVSGEHKGQKILKLELSLDKAVAGKSSADAEANADRAAADQAAADALAEADHNMPQADPQEAGEAGVDDALRLRIQTLLMKIPIGLRRMALGMVQGMDPKAIHGIVCMISQQKALHAQYRSQGDEQRMDELGEVLPQLLAMGPEALKAFALAALQLSCDAENQGDESCPDATAQPPDPLTAMFGALLGGGSTQAAGGVQENPLAQLIGAAFAGKGVGKGVNAHAAAAPPNPLGQLIGAALAGKGMGKCGQPPAQPGANPWGGGSAQAAGPPPNPLGQLIGAALAGKGIGKCGQPPAESGRNPREGDNAQAAGVQPNPFAQIISAALAGKGIGKCGQVQAANVDSSPSAPVSGNACPEQGPSSVPNDALPTSLAPAAETDSTSRVSFESSVEDLVNMGLVADRQVARELMTKHGDISTVVSILTDE